MRGAGSKWQKQPRERSRFKTKIQFNCLWFFPLRLICPLLKPDLLHSTRFHAAASKLGVLIPYLEVSSKRVAKSKNYAMCECQYSRQPGTFEQKNTRKLELLAEREEEHENKSRATRANKYRDQWNLCKPLGMELYYQAYLRRRGADEQEWHDGTNVPRERKAPTAPTLNQKLREILIISWRLSHGGVIFVKCAKSVANPSFFFNYFCYTQGRALMLQFKVTWLPAHSAYPQSVRI